MRNDSYFSILSSGIQINREDNKNHTGKGLRKLSALQPLLAWWELLMNP